MGYSLVWAKFSPNLAKSGQAPTEPSKENPKKKAWFPWILLSGLSLFNGLR
jgi:hypothetical protein